MDGVSAVNIMIDLETLSAEPDALVLSLGAVVLTREGLSHELYLEFKDSAEQQRHGRRISADTVRWWSQQSEAARAVLRPSELPSVKSTLAQLLEFTRYVHRCAQDYRLAPKELALWSNGADFDLVVLRGLYRAFDAEPPWGFWQHRCFRTMKNLFKEVRPPERTQAHHALGDALFQAAHLQRLLKWEDDAP